jgi:hypothetical protein
MIRIPSRAELTQYITRQELWTTMKPLIMIPNETPEPVAKFYILNQKSAQLQPSET